MTEASALSDTAFEMKAVSFAYRDIPALKHLSLYIRKG